MCISFGEVGRPAALARESGVLTAMQIGNAQDLQRLKTPILTSSFAAAARVAATGGTRPGLGTVAAGG